MTLIGCVDVGSTFTKLAVVDTETGTLAATASHPTTLDSDVLHGVDAAVAATGLKLDELRACSSAGGGLRLGVIGYEALVTAEAGYRVGMSAGAKVAHVTTGALTTAAVAELAAARPDVLLLVGGTDGGDTDTIVHNARKIAKSRLKVPVVVAGNAGATEEILGILEGRTAVACENVLPKIGALNPSSARLALRDVFLRHVIGGKKLSRGPRFASLVRGATPDIVLTAVELLDGDVVVADVGGATTDVYSVLTPDPEREAGVRGEVAGTLWRSRTVEGDLGVRWGAAGVVEAAVREKLISPEEETVLGLAAQARVANPAYLADDLTVDARLAELAITVALRRHARGERATPEGPYRGGKDLREVRLVIGSGGVLRTLPAGASDALLAAALADHAGGWPTPRAASRGVDTAYVLAAAGLLASDHPDTARQLLAAITT
ncbi:glutamate mutase L [Longispora albida]|uniref:glutamate mutase L n=1 Tax=Longispora albida TaxID=203523 RepID=UPI000377C744|nr:glutamate mutase L [Longispora albida]